MAEPEKRRGLRLAALTLGVYADLAFNLYSATNSSPQTSELFAGEREETLWKYVKLGHLIALGAGIIGSILDRTLWPLVGTVSVGAIMHGMYRHALEAGKSKKPPSNAAPPNGASVPRPYGWQGVRAR